MPRQCRGITLIEVLIALLVLSIAMLGFAGQQIASLRFSNSSYYLTQATVLAHDLAERMRANRDAALAGSYDVALATPPACSTSVLGGVTPAADIAAWQNTLSCALPLGAGSVTSSDNEFTIIVQWDDSRGAAAPLQFEFTTAL